MTKGQIKERMTWKMNREPNRVQDGGGGLDTLNQVECKIKERIKKTMTWG